MIDHATLLSHFLNTPILAHPRKALIVYNVLVGRLGTGYAHAPIPDVEDEADRQIIARSNGWRAQPMASRFEGEFVKTEDGKFPGIEPFRLSGDGVGLMTITGSMVNRGAFTGANSGVTSYEGIKFQLQRAARSSKVHSLIVDIESPGGQSIGAFETADMVRQLNDVKPVYAVVNGMAASAGYALASGARKIVTTPSGISGSIGVLLLHMDFSKFLEDKGITPTLIHAGAHKADGSPYAPLTDESKADLQAEVDQFYQQFLSTVAAGRGRRLTKTQARETQARTYIGAEAVKIGLADEVGTFEDVLAEANSRARRAAKGSNRSKTTMARNTLLNDDQDNAQALEHARNEGFTAGRTEGFAAGHAEGLAAGRAEAAAAAQQAADSERQRINSIVNDPRCAGNLAAALAMATEFPGATADQVAGMVGRFAPAAPAAPAAEQRPPQPPNQNPYGSLQQRTAATGVNQVGAVPPAAAAVPGEAEAQKLWGDTIAAENKRRAAMADKRGGRH